MKKRILLVIGCLSCLYTISFGQLISPTDSNSHFSKNDYSVINVQNISQKDETLTRVEDLASNECKYNTVQNNKLNKFDHNVSNDETASINGQDFLKQLLATIKDYNNANAKFAISPNDISILQSTDIDKHITEESLKEFGKSQGLGEKAIGDIFTKAEEMVSNSYSINSLEKNSKVLIILNKILKSKELSIDNYSIIKLNNVNPQNLAECLKGSVQIVGGVIFIGTGCVIILVPIAVNTLSLMSWLGIAWAGGITVPFAVNAAVSFFSQQITNLGKKYGYWGRRLFRSGIRKTRNAIGTPSDYATE